MECSVRLATCFLGGQIGFGFRSLKKLVALLLVLLPDGHGKLSTRTIFVSFSALALA